MYGKQLRELTCRSILFPLQDDDDGHLTGLQIIEDLLEKCQETYISHLARLGVISHVAELAGPLQEVETVQEEPAVRANEEETEKKVHVWYDAISKLSCLRYL